MKTSTLLKAGALTLSLLNTIATDDRNLRGAPSPSTQDNTDYGWMAWLMLSPYIFLGVKSL
jgi:hypothetical protein